MQRQSLGSPSTKHLLHESSSSSSLSTNTSLIYEPEEKEQVKKLLKLKPKLVLTNSHETYIHLIPILTLLCFLILYLSSHNPSQNDLAQFNGFNRLHNPRDLGENISELQGIVEIKKGDILAVRSLKNLVRQEEINQRRLHRRFLGRV
ncbi:hypothetical protein ACJIZ3_009673 [Penstemon smallii]|uniref:Uncharacterized protein n=1 Tax=Penstemon smallii TaxID=265156 RepID=A0ABD3TF33_9LAMI